MRNYFPSMPEGSARVYSVIAGGAATAKDHESATPAPPGATAPDTIQCRFGGFPHKASWRTSSSISMPTQR